MDKQYNLYGRLFTKRQVEKEDIVKANKLLAMKWDKSQLICNRCGSYISNTHRLDNGKRYCRECIVFGRVEEGDYLYYFSSPLFDKGDFMTWKGKLTPWQEKVSNQIVENIMLSKKDTLVHAVTGSGKTEMVYSVIEKTVNLGGIVAFSSPRIDICREIYQRLQADFSCSIDLLTSYTPQFKQSQIVVLTTHQLIKFYRHFDLLIIDEVDAFPYVDNKNLHFSADNAIKSDGRRLFLTATTTKDLDIKVRKGELSIVHLYKRFHNNKLIVPKLIWAKEVFKKQEIHPKILKQIQKQRETNFPLMIFVPEIHLASKVAISLARILNDKVESVSSIDKKRVDKVEQFRKGTISILVTTTILERGVTFPKVDVMVLQANHPHFTKSSLVQIAGRVGRSPLRPKGEVILFHNGVTKAIQAAVKEIKYVNRKGG